MPYSGRRKWTGLSTGPIIFYRPNFKTGKEIAKIRKQE